MIRALCGDCLELLPTLAEASIDACVTDPPYGLSFMGKNWDHGVPGIPFWKQVLRVLKPGGHLLAFGGSRTYHRLACAIEDAGFEIRDQIMWIYGSGFPKSLDVGKAIDKAAGENGSYGDRKPNIHSRGDHVLHEGWKRPWMDDPEAVDRSGREYIPATDTARKYQGFGTALKPAHEPIVLARKPLIGTVAANVLAHGTGALNIDGCRVEGEESTERPSGVNVGIYGADDRHGMIRGGTSGRWPANVIHDGSEEVVGAFPDCAASSGGSIRQGVGVLKYNDENARPQHAESGGQTVRPGYEGSGSAARFFYSAKADKGDRLSSKHPTVKPVDLMAYLCRLVCPPNGTVLDPFAGSGSTGMACMREGFDAILIEREAEYVRDIKRRIAHVSGEDAPLFASV